MPLLLTGKGYILVNSGGLTLCFSVLVIYDKKKSSTKTRRS